ncbi:hypothetical protein JXB22_02210 [candidate division WOR-3 bacterium]|nr:hypothetical protein [candidate division WOR-3 bacterium]
MKKSNKKNEYVNGDINLVRERIFANKERFHNTQAKLPLPEKIRLLVELQKIANAIKRKSATEPGFIWQI